MNPSGIGDSFRRLRQKWAKALALPFHEILSAEIIAEATRAEGLTFRDRTFSPLGHPVGFPGPGLGCRRFLPTDGRKSPILLPPTGTRTAFPAHRRLLQSASAPK